MQASPDLSAISRRTLLSIWWAFMWRYTLTSLVSSFGISMVVSFIGASAGYQPNNLLVQSIGFGLTFIVCLPLSLWALHSALKRQHGAYTLVCVETARVVTES